MKIFNILITVFIAAIFYTCSNEQSTDQNNGNWIEITDTLSFNIDCIDFDKTKNFDKFIIRNQDEYTLLDSLRYRGSSWPNCNNYIFPEIDFNTYSLLGCVIKWGPHETVKRVYRNNSDKKVKYQLDLTLTSLNKILMIKNNWLLVPKIPDDYEVVIDTTMRYRIN